MADNNHHDGTSTLRGDGSDNDGSALKDGYSLNDGPTIDSITSAVFSELPSAWGVLIMLNTRSRFGGDDGVSDDIIELSEAISAFQDSRQERKDLATVRGTALKFLQVKSSIYNRYKIDHPGFVAHLERQLADPSFFPSEPASTSSGESDADTSRDDPPELASTTSGEVGVDTSRDDLPALASTSSREVGADTFRDDPSRSEGRGGNRSFKRR